VGGKTNLTPCKACINKGMRGFELSLNYRMTKVDYRARMSILFLYTRFEDGGKSYAFM